MPGSWRDARLSSPQTRNAWGVRPQAGIAATIGAIALIVPYFLVCYTAVRLNFRPRPWGDGRPFSPPARRSTDMTDLYVTWDDYHTAIERLAAQVHASAWEFNQIVCIARGGLRVGDTMSRIFKLPLAITFTQSYVENAGTVRGEIIVSTHLAMTTSSLGDRVLLVDDLVDTGITLKVVQAHLMREYPDVKEIRTAVLWQKERSTFIPDYRVEYLADNPWIHQPFERYDAMAPEDLAERKV
jgi:hypoxanthine phosphoribosyltransferase